MRLTTNDKLIERQSRLARYATFSGLAVLIASFLTTTPLLGNFPISLSYLLLLVGFVLAFFGARLATKWVKEPRADNALTKALKGFDNKHHLYNFLLPAPHVLLTPTGILVFRVKPQDGAVSCHGGKWTQQWRWSRLIGGMGQESIGDPTAELRQDIARLRQLLADKFEGAGVVPVDGYIVFTDPNVELSIEGSNAPVVRADDLKETLRKGKRGAALPQRVIDDLNGVLDQAAHGGVS